jgi:glucose-1-phosphate thymidylyltransferase
LHDASEFVRVIEKRQGFKIGCLEEIAYRMHFIGKDQLMTLAKKFEKSGYGEYLKNVEK